MTRVPIGVAAYAVQVPVRTLYRWVADERLTVARRGDRGPVLVDLDELADLTAIMRPELAPHT